MFIYGNNLSAQSIGQAKRFTAKFVGVNNESYNGGGLLFVDGITQNYLTLSNNQVIDLPAFYEGISLKDSIWSYTDQDLVIDMMFMHHLCNEGSYDYDCTGWVVTGINTIGTPKSTRKINLPKIGKIVDPDGYVNVRSQMNVKSSIVGKLEPSEINHECFYFYTCSDPNWYRIDCVYDGVKLLGYIHASRIKIIH